MPRSFQPGHLDVAKFAAADGILEGRWKLVDLDRLVAEASGADHEDEVHWWAEGSRRSSQSGEDQMWLRVRARASIRQVCQRCLEPVAVELDVDRWFRFVPDEDTAMAQDDASEEDLLVLTRSLDLKELVEDELLLELPQFPRHERCPVTVRDRVADPGFVDPGAEASRRPFEALAALKAGKIAKAR